MPKREKFTGYLECQCGNKGRAEYEDNANPVHGGGLGTTTLSIVEGSFQLNNDGSITCDQCDATLADN